MNEIANIVLLIILAIAVAQDICSMKIKNELIFIGLFLGMIFRLGREGVSSLVPGMWNILFPVLIFYLIFRIGVIGAGDIKLFSVIGSFLSFQDLVRSMVSAFLLGAVISLVVLLRNRNFITSMIRAREFITRLSLGESVNYAQMDVERENYMHFSIAIAIGVVLVLCKQYL